MPETSATNSILTKSRAKYGKCLNPKNYKDLIGTAEIKDVVSYLKQHTWYADVLANVKESAIHRGNLEKLIYTAVRAQIINLCNFDKSVGSDSFQFINYLEDVRIILSYTRYVLSDNVKDFLTDATFGNDKETETLYKKIIEAKTLPEVGNVILLTPFKQVASLFKDAEQFDYPLVESQLYKIAFDVGFDAIKDNFNGTEYTEIYNLLSLYTEVKDLQMIYRQKRFISDDLSRPERLLIGENCIISDNVLKQLLRCETTEEFLNIFWTTPYKKFKEKFASDSFDLLIKKVLLYKALKQIHFSQYSCVVLFSFIIILETEYDDLSTIIEGVRYHLPADDIYSMLINNFKE